MKCNLCDNVLKVDEKSIKLLEHVKEEHRDIYYLHKDNPEATVGFRIEFLNLNMLKEDGDPKTQPILLGEVCEATTTEQTDIIPKEDTIIIHKDAEISIKDTEMQYVLWNDKKKQNKDISAPRKRSWVWKYFDKLSNIIYRCRLCNVVLSIKGCNSNNMNRHVRTRHPMVFRSEVNKREKGDKDESCFLVTNDMEGPYVIKTEEIYTSNKDFSDVPESPTQKLRRSWIWSYFVRVSNTQAQCKLCKRHICHGGNATGNMNRHLKMIHKKTACSYNQTWVWKVFDSMEDNFYACKICQFKCMKHNDLEKDMSAILEHLKSEHGVVSGDQIITGSDVEGDVVLG